MLLNTEKCQGNSFYRFWDIKGKPTGEGGKITAPTHIEKITTSLEIFLIVSGSPYIILLSCLVVKNL